MIDTTCCQDHPVVVIWNIGTKSLANLRMYSVQFAMNLLVSTVLTVFLNKHWIHKKQDEDKQAKKQTIY